MTNIDSSKRPVVVASCLALLCISIAAIIYNLTHRNSKVGALARKLHAVVGQVAAEETIKLLSGHGRIVVVTLDTSLSKSRPAETELDGFNKAIKAHRSLIVVATEKVVPESSVMVRESGLAAQTFLEILGQHPDVDAIVSFAGAPGLSIEDIRALPPKMPKVVAVMALTFSGRLKSLFELNVIHVAIAPRFSGAPAGAKAPKTDREWFDSSFQVLTPEKAALLPDHVFRAATASDALPFVALDDVRQQLARSR